MTLTPNNTIKSHVEKFLQQESDHEWLMMPLNCKGGKDQFKNTVVYSTFPSNLNRDDFAYYVDTTFSDLKENMRERMKGLYIASSQSFQQEDILFDYGTTDGKISASLIQVISQKNAFNVLEVIAGVISPIRTPEVGGYFNNKYWQSDKARVKRGLQYMFGNEAQQELSYH